MNILVAHTADLKSRELAALVEILAEKHKVFVCGMAVDSHQRGSSFSSVETPVMFERVDYKSQLAAVYGDTKKSFDKFSKVEAYEFYGTPSDAVSVMLSEILTNKNKVDVVISGINNGWHFGTDIFCSSNIAMAFQAAFEGVRGIAIGYELKIGGHSANEMAAPAAFIKQNLDKLLKINLPPYTILNINIPASESVKDYKGVKVPTIGKLEKLSKYIEKVDCTGEKYYWEEIVSREDKTDDENSTANLMKSGFISIAPLTYDMTNHKRIDKFGAVLEKRARKEAR
ncbi:MAG: hypothetical protein LBM01_01910 [Christensenellaceae bacterium]|jgi:5'-nucleotidase|nr:hypothetical protein [Christensenellaceae bacterium]